MPPYDRDQLLDGTRTGRYAKSGVSTWTDPDGRQIPYRQRRFLPRGQSRPLLVEITVKQGDRLDLIAGEYLGDPEQYFRICDANDAMNPFAHVSEPGIGLRIPIPSFETES